MAKKIKSKKIVGGKKNTKTDKTVNNITAKPAAPKQPEALSLPKAALKALKQNGSPTKKRETIVRSPAPMLLPLVIYSVFAIACYVLGTFEILSRPLTFSAFALGSFLIAGYVIVAMRFEHLKSSLGIGLVALWAALTLLAMALPLKSAIFYSEPTVEKLLTSGARTMEVVQDGKGRKYMALLNGHFTKLDEIIAEEQAAQAVADQSAEGKKEDKKKQKSYFLEGAYTLALQDKNKAELNEYEGRFTAQGQKRRLSKKGRGYLETHNTTTKHVFKLPKQDGPFELTLTFLDEELSKGIDVIIYPWKNYPILNYFLAIIAMLVGSVIDHLLKAKKNPGWFTFGAGIFGGFGNYYLTEATPLTTINIFVFDLVIGGVIALVFAFGILYGMDPLLTKINRKLHINL